MNHQFFQKKTLVMKFGGAAVADISHFSRVAEHVLTRRGEYDQIVVVVSAMSGTTDQLIALAHQVHPSPPRREYDMLISVGERISCSLLAMAIVEKGGEAVSFTGSQAGIITSEEHADALILDVIPRRIVDPLANGVVVIVAGFQGVSRKGAITTLGRSGSDTTAVAMAAALAAQRVEFYKDVGGIFSEDPKKSATARHLPELSYADALTITARCGSILHPRSLRLAEKNGIPLYIRSFLSPLESVIFDSSLKRPLAPLYE